MRICRVYVGLRMIQLTRGNKITGFIAMIILILVVTNPTEKEFDNYLGYSKPSSSSRRISYFAVFSIYTFDDREYIGQKIVYEYQGKDYTKSEIDKWAWINRMDFEYYLKYSGIKKIETPIYKKTRTKYIGIFKNFIKFDSY